MLRELLFLICVLAIVNSQKPFNRNSDQQGEPSALMVGGRKELDLENDSVLSVVRDLSNFSLQQISKKRASDAARLSGIIDEPVDATDFSYSLVEVVSAQSQVVAGVKYYLKIRMKKADCKRNCPIEVCDLEVYERKWENFRNLTNFNCVQIKKQPKLGALNEIPLTNEQALQALDFGIARINQESNDLYQHKLVKLNKVWRQVVAGFKYVFEFSIGKTTCTKNDINHLNLKQCPLQENAPVRNCRVEIWDQPWMDRRYKMLNQNCTSANA